MHNPEAEIQAEIHVRAEIHTEIRAEMPEFMSRSTRTLHILPRQLFSPITPCDAGLASEQNLRMQVLIVLAPGSICGISPHMSYNTGYLSRLASRGQRMD
jgi:hypothetical protein